MSDYQKIKSIPTFGITLYKRDDITPNIYYYFTYQKKSYRGSTGTEDPNQAEKNAILKYYEIQEHKGKKNVVKFETVVKKFLKYKETRVSPKTFSEYVRQSRFLLEKFKGKDIETFGKKNYHDYEDWRKNYYSTHEKKKIQTYKKNGKKVKGVEYQNVGNTTINREVGLLVTILRYSQQELELLKEKIVPSWEKLSENRREEILRKEEYEKLKEYWKRKNPYYWEIISFVQNTGIRYPSELNQIKWKNVFLNKKFMVIIRKGKPNKPMSVPLVGTSYDILKRLKERQGIPTGPDDYVFVNDKGKRILNIRKSWNKALVECGINRPLSMYSLRHLFTTRMITTRPDIPMKVISEILGHADSKMIDKVYSHLRIEQTVKILEQSEEKKRQILKDRKKHQII